MQNLLTIGSGDAAAHAQNSPLGVYFFFLQTSPLDRPTPLMAQTKRPDAGHILYKFSIKNFKILFFLAQFLKICITAYGVIKAV